jgi:two-component system, OmpR family, phosphate regulon sensor histidine kinase PhoR
MTLRSPLFRKLLLGAFLLILLTVVVLDLYVTRFVSAREVDAVQRQLDSQARLLSGEVQAVPAPELQSWSRQAQQRAQSRITVIDPAGVVMADSERDPATMENHAGRPEVRQALEGRRGVSIRHSDTIDVDLVYLAMPLTYGAKPGYVFRVAVPLKNLNAAIAEVRRGILRVSLIVTLAALAVAYFITRYLTGRIRRVQQFAEGLVQARFTDRMEPEPADELGSLSRSLNGMAEQMQNLIERLSLESARREAMLSSMVEGVLAVDHELCVTFCNESLAHAVGARVPIPDRLPLLELIRDPAFLNLLTRVLVTGASQKERLQLAAAEGRSFEIQAAPLEMRSRRGAIAILHDITDLERLERVRKDFVANVSHELRTPLAAIQGYAETLLEGALEDKENNRRFLEIIKSHAVRLNAIASDLLVLSELETGESAPAPERVSILDAIECALRSVESEAKLRQVRIHCGGLADVAVTGNKIRLEQALVNLFDNAVKFNRPSGEVWVEAGCTTEGKVRITVADSGIGIPSDDLPRIFERFYRVDKARSRDVGGTGLGLSIVKHIVERMGGTVSVESQLGKGAKFTMLLPPG